MTFPERVIHKKTLIKLYKTVCSDVPIYLKTILVVFTSVIFS